MANGNKNIHCYCTYYCAYCWLISVTNNKQTEQIDRAHLGEFAGDVDLMPDARRGEFTRDARRPRGEPFGELLLLSVG